MRQTGAVISKRSRAMRPAGARFGCISLAALCLALGALPLQAQAQRPVSTAERALQLQQQRERWEALPEADRKAVQDSLVWLGLYNGVTDGAFGQRTADAVAAFEKRELLQPGAVVAGPGLAVLRAAANKQKSAVGFTQIDDAATGARIGSPARLFDRKESAPGRTRLSSSRTPASLTLFAGGAADGDLPAWFARATSAAPGRKVTYKLLRPDFAVVTGDEGARRFFTRVAAGPDGLRGFTFVYPVTDAAAMDRVTIAIANSFVPFAGKPGAIPPGAASSGGQQPGQPASGAQAALRPDGAAATSQFASSPLTGTALLIGPGRALTATAAVRGCKDIRLGDATATVTASDRQSDLSLLSAAGVNPANAGPITLAPAGDGQPAGALVLAAWTADPAGKPQLSVIPGQFIETRQTGKVNAALQPGGAGALALDNTGAIVGVISGQTAAPAVAGVALAADQPLANADSVRRLLADAGVTPQAAASAGAAPEGAGAIVARWRARLAPVSCGAR
ncbi:peptidoglycan-binding domain-containing protein [Camelimonas fluminis]|uniref:Peptidoglycan-binding domain-containing protein n=1 Tax=Camelimonas fluminis TaxID=1576911 RepID=A0ABV7UC40_9HYPH|nr:peptidoglycan-binding protein [Camelimonas fluminis]